MSENKDLQKDVIDSIKEVSDTLGNYYKENIYQNALSIELKFKFYVVQTEVIVPILYKNINVGFERADIVIYDDKNFIIEVKSQTTRINSKEIEQIRKYLTNLKCDKGILVNFYDKLEIYEVTNLTVKKLSMAG